MEKVSRLWSSCSIVVLLAICSLPGGKGALELNVLDMVDLKPSTIGNFQGVTLTSGKESGTAAFILGSKTSSLSNENRYKEFKSNFDRSADTTLVFTFKLDKSAVSQKHTIFSLVSPTLGRQYLSFIVRVANVTDVGIEGAAGKTKMSMSVDMLYRVYSTDQPATFQINDKFDIETWQHLMIRIIDHTTVKAYLGCGNPPLTQQLVYPLPKMPTRAQMRAAQSAQRDIFTGNPLIYNRVMGVVQRIEFLFGTEAYEFLNPCIPRENTLRPEGLASTPAEAAYLLKYLELTQNNLPKDCTYSGKQYISGANFKDGICNSCNCNNGVVNCVKDTCSALSCPDKITPDGECCAVCQETYCTRFHKTYLPCGCTKTCGVVTPTSDCASRCTKGCHCPVNMHEDIDGKCVPQQLCRCKSADGATIYKPNEISSSNPCLFCVCSLGILRCMRVCFGS